MKSFCMLLLAGAVGLPGPARLSGQNLIHYTVCAEFWKGPVPYNGIHTSVLLDPPNGPLVQGTYSPDEPCSELTVDAALVSPGLVPNWTPDPPADPTFLNGVTILDLLRISRHILGLEPLNSPFARIAADVNKSGSITTFDIVEARKLLLGIYDELPNNASWRYVDSCFIVSFQNPFNPFNCVGLPPLADGVEATVTALKVGDVDGDAVLSGAYLQSPTPDSGLLVMPPMMLTAGVPVSVPFVLGSSLSVFGLQVEFAFDPSQITIVGVEGDEFVMDSFYNYLDPAGRLTLLSSLNQLLGSSTFPSPGDTLFRLDIMPQVSGPLEDAISLDGSRLKPLYVGEFGSFLIALASGQVSSQFDPWDGTRIEPAQPNPFSDRSIVRLQLDRTEWVEMEVIDLTGRITFSYRERLLQGEHLLEIPADAVAKGGLGFYRIRAGTGRSSGKLVRE